MTGLCQADNEEDGFVDYFMVLPDFQGYSIHPNGKVYTLECPILPLSDVIK